jgi:hypothetical protein
MQVRGKSACLRGQWSRAMEGRGQIDRWMRTERNISHVRGGSETESVSRLNKSEPRLGAIQ